MDPSSVHDGFSFQGLTGVLVGAWLIIVFLIIVVNGAEVVRRRYRRRLRNRPSPAMRRSQEGQRR